MTHRSLSLCVVFAAAGLAAAADPPPHRQSGDLAIQARHILHVYCGTCHNGADARGRLKVSDHPALTNFRAPLPFATKDRALIVEMIEGGMMPPGNRPRPTDAEVAVLKNWVAAGAPAYPPRFDDANSSAAVVAHLNGLSPLDRGYARYVSFAHLLPDASAKSNIEPALAALAKAETDLRAAVGESPTAAAKRLKPVDAAGTLFHLDLRDVGWGHRDLFVPADAPADTFPMIPFDLILLENPHAVTGWQSDDDVGQAVKVMTDHRKGEKVWHLFRPQPFLRGNWLAEALGSKEQPTQLAIELKALADLAAVKDKPDELRKLKGPKPKPLADTTPLVAPRPPLGSWMKTDVAAADDTFKLVVTTDPAGPKIPLGSGFKLTATCDLTAALTLLEVAPGGQITTFSELKSGAKLKPNAPTKVTANDDGTFVLNAVGPVHYVVYVAEKPLALHVVQSKHGPRNSQIWRFFPADPDVPASRKVITFDVTE